MIIFINLKCYQFSKHLIFKNLFSCRADNAAYPHDGRADKRHYQHDRRADSQCRRIRQEGVVRGCVVVVVMVVVEECREGLGDGC